MITKIESYNESIRDKMTPKSDEDIKELLDKLPPVTRIDKIMQMGVQNLYTKEEIDILVKKLSVEQMIDKGLAYGLMWAVREGMDKLKKATATLVDENKFSRFIQLAVDKQRPDMLECLLENPKLTYRNLASGVSQCNYGKKYRKNAKMIQMRKILVDRQIKILKETNDWYILLLVGCSENNYEYAKYAIELGKSRHILDKPSLENGLKRAVQSNNIDIIKLLLDNGTPVSSSTFHETVKTNNTEIIKLLLDHMKEEIWNDSIRSVVLNNNVEVLEMIKTRGKDIADYTRNLNQTILMKWMRDGDHDEMLRYLMKNHLMDSDKVRKTMSDKISKLDKEIKSYRRFIDEEG